LETDPPPLHSQSLLLDSGRVDPSRLQSIFCLATTKYYATQIMRNHLRRNVKNKITHVHIKDVSESLALAMRGGQTGIAVSQCAIGDGVNAANIRRCLEILRDHGYNGVLSMECEGQGGPMIERSLAWLRRTLDELGIKEEN